MGNAVNRWLIILAIAIGAGITICANGAHGTMTPALPSPGTNTSNCVAIDQPLPAAAKYRPTEAPESGSETGGKCSSESTQPR
jgi:hypothetical protein